MPSEQDIRYHRSFLSVHYMDNFARPSMIETLAKRGAEIDAIRARDPEGFEDRRKLVAKLMSVPFKRGYTEVRRGDQGGRDRWVEGIPSDAKVAECMVPDDPPQGVVLSPETGMAALPNFLIRRKAYVTQTGIHPVDVYEKTDQRFEEFATPWELLWSDLSAPYTRGFTPIVDRDWTVIGHMGEVAPRANESVGEPSLIIPSKLVGRYNLREALDRGVPIFVHSSACLPAGWANADFFTTETALRVRTGLDGEVVDYKATMTGGLIEPWYSPMDLIAAAKILVGLTKFGLKLATSLVLKRTARLEARAALKGATRALANEAEREATRDAARDAARVVSEGDLGPIGRTRGISRVLTPAEMEALLRDTLSKRPYLARLRLAQRMDGPELTRYLMGIIEEWKAATNKQFLRVRKGVVQRVGSMGKGGWARDAVSGKDVLIIEEEAFANPRELLTEVRHELSYEAVWDGANGVPSLDPRFPLKHANAWLKNVIELGDRSWDELRKVGNW